MLSECQHIAETSDDIEDIRQEIQILSTIDTPHVTKYYGSYVKGTQLWIVMELCGGGSCLDLVRSPITRDACTADDGCLFANNAAPHP